MKLFKILLILFAFTPMFAQGQPCEKGFQTLYMQTQNEVRWFSLSLAEIPEGLGDYRDFSKNQIAKKVKEQFVGLSENIHFLAKVYPTCIQAQEDDFVEMLAVYLIQEELDTEEPLSHTTLNRREELAFDLLSSVLDHCHTKIQQPLTLNYERSEEMMQYLMYIVSLPASAG